MQSGSVFHPSKTACHMVTGHKVITRQHQPQPGGKKGNNFPSSPHISTASVSNGHGAENWSLQNLELPLYPLSASHTAVRSPAATDSRLSREPLPCHHRSLRPPEHPWAIFIMRIQAIFTLYWSINGIFTIFGFHERAQLSPHRPLLPPEPPKHFLFNNASLNLVTRLRHTPHVCDAALQTTFLWSIILRLNWDWDWDNKRLLLCGCFWISFVFLKVSILNTVVQRFILASQRCQQEPQQRALTGKSPIMFCWSWHKWSHKRRPY